ncbi:hypothetical protein BDN72DRAFT_959847 [Pluteus cervinus]|uniref:Uncharacterized protein n=1 Tax=Pluteus cervinus TaxID=181527 RepID=A0ACD3ASS0_9AGAR|nr:hypothetical protein BDN72DRAFT_959847 [Pluteus cervinus]
MASDDNETTQKTSRTRPGNRTKRPGDADRPRSKRTHEEVEEERQVAAAQREEEAKAKAKAKKKVVHIQTSLEEEKDILDQIRTNPFRPTSGVQKTPRKSSNPQKDKASAPKVAEKTATSSAAAGSRPKIMSDDPSEDELNVDRSSRPSGGDEGDGLEGRAEAPLPSPTESRKRKDGPLEDSEKGGNEKPPKNSTKKPKLTSHLQVSGIHPDWEKKKRLAVVSPPEPETETTTATSNTGASLCAGGIVGEDEEADDVERQVYVKKSSVAGRVKPAKSSTPFDQTKVPFTINRPPPPQPKSQRAARGGAKKWKLTNLPDNVNQDNFTKILTPLARAKLGTISPWASLTTKDVQKLVDKVFGKDPRFVVDAEGVWFGLVGYRTATWRNGFSKAASDSVKHLLDQHDKTLNTKDRIKSFINGCLEEVTAANENQIRTLAFHWRVLKDGKKKGFFQNPLIIRTFAIAHLATLNPKDVDEPEADSDGKKRWPMGALILAAQSVEHALNAWTTGTLITKQGPAGFFSSDNYGDHTKRQTDPQTGRAITVNINRATCYIPTIKNFKDEHWEKIYEGAKEFFEQKNHDEDDDDGAEVGTEPKEIVMVDDDCSSDEAPALSDDPEAVRGSASPSPSPSASALSSARGAGGTSKRDDAGSPDLEENES